MNPETADSDTNTSTQTTAAAKPETKTNDTKATKKTDVAEAFDDLFNN